MNTSTALEQLDPLFHDLETSIREADYSNELRDIMSVIAAQELLMFANETDSNGSPWLPLKPSTTKRKSNDRILVDTGALIESLVHVGGSGNINETAPRDLLFGTDVGYAQFHDTGTCRMPARPPVGLSEETLGKLCNTIADATVELLKG